MITIKKYPNRRLYNTQTSTYINLDGIQNLIQNGTVVCIVDSKTGDDVTTETLIHHVFDASVLEALIPGTWMQSLMQMSSNERRLEAIQSRTSVYSSVQDIEMESETQADERTQPKIDVQDMGEFALEDRDESSDSESEVTMVRIEEAPIIPSTVLESTKMVKEGTNVGPMDIDVPVDAWRQTESDGGGEEGVGIPSFWSNNEGAAVGISLKKDEVLDRSFDSDEDLFTQPETIVVQQVEEVPLGQLEFESTQRIRTVGDFESISDSSVSFELYSHEEFISKVERVNDSEGIEVSEESNTVDRLDASLPLNVTDDAVLSFDKDSVEENSFETSQPLDQSNVKQRSVEHIEHSVEPNLSISTRPFSVNEAVSSSHLEDSSHESSRDSEISVTEIKPVGESDTVNSPKSSSESLSKSAQMQARLEAMKASFRK